MQRQCLRMTFSEQAWIVKSGVIGEPLANREAGDPRNTLWHGCEGMRFYGANISARTAKNSRAALLLIDRFFSEIGPECEWDRDALSLLAGRR